VIAPFDPPIDIGRDEAARAARDELSKEIYHRDDPGIIASILQWILERAQELLFTVALHSPGGSWGLLALVLVLVIAIVVIRWRLGAVARSAAERTSAVFTGRARTAAEHRAAAEAALAAGDYDTACRERFRAVVRTLEERTFLDERPGRTADEVARDVAAIAPQVADELAAAARVFDDVCYGGEPGTAAAHAVIQAADDAVCRLRGRAAVATVGAQMETGTHAS